MLRRDSKVKVSFIKGARRVEFPGVVEKVRPLKVRLGEGKAGDVRSDVAEKTLVDLQDPGTNETVLTAIVEEREGNNILQLKGLGDREMRQYVRVNAILPLSYIIVREEKDLMPRENVFNADVGEPLPAMNRYEMRALAQTEEASEAVLYLIRAVQALDRKLEGLSSMVKRLSENQAVEEVLWRKTSISGSGIYFENEEQLDETTRLNIAVRLPMDREITIHAICVVVRADRVTDDESGEGKYGIACRFESIREAYREKIISFAVKKQREALRRMRAAADRF